MLKIILFRKGRPGIMINLPGEHPVEEELETLLGGATEMTPIDERLTLAALKDGEKLRLPLRYRLCRGGKADEPIAGDCAVLAVNKEGRYTDVTLRDYLQTEAAVKAAGGTAS